MSSTDHTVGFMQYGPREIMMRSEHELRELNIDTARPDAQYDTTRYDTTRTASDRPTIPTCTANPAQYIRFVVRTVFPRGVQYSTIRTARMPVANRDILFTIREIFFYAQEVFYDTIHGSYCNFRNRIVNVTNRSCPDQDTICSDTYSWNWQ
jgi:hypothetical protein